MKVLFVCTGNTCRSCMAEAIFNNLCITNNIEEFSSFSAGIFALKESKTSSNTVSVIKEKLGIDMSDRNALPITSDFLIKGDIVLTMTVYLKNILISKYPNYKDKVFSISEYVGTHEDIEDPFGQSIDIYEQTYEQLAKLISLLINKLKKDRGII